MSNERRYLVTSSAAILVYAAATSDISVVPAAVTFLSALAKEAFEVALPYVTLGVILVAIYLQMGGVDGIRTFSTR